MVIPDTITILKEMLKSVLRYGGVLTVIASLLLSGCGDPAYSEKSPEDIKVIKAVEK